MKKTLLIGISLLGSAAIAHAQGLGDASTFNAFIFGNYALASDSDGPIAAGGAMTGSQNINMHNFKGTIGATTGIDVYGGPSSSVGGNLDGSGGNVYLQRGTFSANNNASAAIHIGANSTLSNAFAADVTYLKNLSTAIAAYTPGSGNGYDFNVDWTHNGGNDALFHYGSHTFDMGTHNNPSMTFGAGGIAANFTSGGVNVYVLDITASELSTLNSNAGNITFNGLNSTNTLLINVIGDGTHAVTWHPQQQTNSSNNYVLYNFTNTPTVNTDQLFTGSILAPNASLVQGSGDIQGNVIANSFTQDAEIHFGSDGNGNFQGFTPQAVPEPASLVALATAGIAFFRKRK
jgi:choice-of-anchor A domain-containing protein